MRDDMREPGGTPGNKGKQLFSRAFFYTVCFIVLTGLYLQPAMSEEGTSVTLVYDLLLDGDDAGDVTTSRAVLSDGILRIRTTTECKLSGWWGDWSLASSEEVLVDDVGVRRFDHEITEDDKTWLITGERHNHALWISAREILTKKEEEDAGGDMTPVSLLKDGRDGQGSARLPLEEFDVSATELPLFLLKNKDALKKKKVRVLDTAEMEIRPCIIEGIGRETITLAARGFSCHKFSVKTDDGRTTYWIARDDLGAFMVKEEGKDKDGSHVVILKIRIIGIL